MSQFTSPLEAGGTRPLNERMDAPKWARGVSEIESGHISKAMELQSKLLCELEEAASRFYTKTQSVMREQPEKRQAAGLMARAANSSRLANAINDNNERISNLLQLINEADSCVDL